MWQGSFLPLSLVEYPCSFGSQFVKKHYFETRENFSCAVWLSKCSKLLCLLVRSSASTIQRTATPWQPAPGRRLPAEPGSLAPVSAAEDRSSDAGVGWEGSASSILPPAGNPRGRKGTAGKPRMPSVLSLPNAFLVSTPRPSHQSRDRRVQLPQNQNTLRKSNEARPEVWLQRKLPNTSLLTFFIKKYCKRHTFFSQRNGQGTHGACPCAPRTVPPLPASPGFGRLEVPRRLRVSSQNRRCGPPGAPCDTRLSAITWSLHQGQTAAAAEARNLQDRLTRGPNVVSVPERRGFHQPAGTDDAGQGTRCCSARPAGHTISSDQGVKSGLSPGVPKSRPRSGTTACTDSPLCAAQNLPSPQACLLPPARTGMLACPPHLVGQAAGEDACGVRERLLQSGGQAAPSQSICKFWAFPS